MGQIANKLSQEKRSRKEMMSFGLFDNNQSNYNTYYPDVTAEDLNPKDSEFVYPIFRALSEVVVHKEWNPVDFSRNGVLRKSMPLLNGATINVDHEDAVGNAVGAVSSVSWEEARKMGKILVPAGINAKMKIDGKSHPRLARALMMKPPAIHSDSVTVQFMWDKSHPALTEEEFMKGLGSYDSDGKLISRIATDIRKYPEISLVNHGADPYAQIKDGEGNINNPTYAAISYNSLSNKQKKGQKIFMFDFKTDLIRNTAKKNSIPQELINKSQTSDMKEILALVAAFFGISLDEKKPDLKLLKAKIKEFKDDKTASESKLAAVDKMEKTLEKLKEFRKEQVSKLRKETLKNYNLLTTSQEAEVEESVITLINGAKVEALEALNTDYKKKLDKSYPLSCADCGGDNVSRATTVVDGAKKKTPVIDLKEVGKYVERKKNRKTVHDMHS